MANYQLIVNISDSDVQKICENQQQITMVKEIGDSGSQPTVAWVCTSPFQRTSIEWSNKYGLYVSQNICNAGAKITKLAYENPARPQYSYTFQNNIFGSQEVNDSLSNNEYQVQNRSNQDLTFGLTQAVTANGLAFEANPLNAVVVLRNQTATFSVKEKLKLFLSSRIDNGVVISTITSDALELDFTTQPIQTVNFINGHFIRAKITGL